jgi:WD40 repeat protein/tetratricopeptide (TPR) repeat protein
LTNELSQPTTTTLLLHGPRLIGKTSLLHQLPCILPPDDFVSVYFDLQTWAERPLPDLLTALAQTINGALGCEAAVSTDPAPFITPALLQALDSRRLVLAFDEMEHITAQHPFWHFIRQLNAEPQVACVFVTHFAAADLPSELTEIFKGAVARPLGTMTEASAAAMLQQMPLSTEALEYLLDLTGQHPFFLQLWGHELGAQAELSDTEIEITVADIDALLPELLTHAAAAFTYLWMGLNEAERLYVAAVAALHEEPAFLAETAVQQAITAQSARLRPFRINWTLAELVQRHILVMNIKRQYRFALPLFHYWVRQHKPLALVREELDQENGVAEKLFQIGQIYLQQENHKKAVYYFQQTIKENPYHAAAQQFLGNALWASGDTEKAIGRLERAYAINPEEARRPLAQAFIHKAQRNFEANDRKGALAACERLREILPPDDALVREVDEVYTAVWNQRGDMALKHGLIEKALSAYRQAGNSEKIAELEGTRLDGVQTQLEQEAQAAIEAGQWQKAADLYVRLVSLYPFESKERIKADKALERCREEVELAGQFDEGVKALQNEDWLQARMAFMKVIMRQMNYTRHGQRAMELLDKAAKGRSFTRLLSPTGLGEKRPSSPQNIITADAVFQIVDQAQLGKGAINQIAYSTSGAVLALATNRGIYLYHAQMMHEINFIETNAPITSVAFSPDGGVLASAAWDKIVHLWWVNDGKLLGILQGHSRPVRAVAYSPDGRYLASGGDDQQIIIWQADLGKKIRVLTGHEGSVNALAFAPDGERLLSGSSDNTVRLWQIHNGDQLFSLSKHQASVTSVAFAPDGHHIATGSQDNTAHIWHLQESALRRVFRRQTAATTLLVQHEQGVNSVAYSPDGDFFATAASDNIVRLWQPDTGELIQQLEGHISPVVSLAFTPDGYRLASASRHLVRQWDLNAYTTDQMIEGHLGPIHRTVVSADGRILAIATGRQILIWPMGADKPSHILEGHHDLVLSLAFAPDGATLVSGSADHSVCLWQIDKNEPLHTFTSNAGPILDVAYSADGLFVAAASEDYTIVIWESASGQLVRRLTGHEGAVTALSFADNGRFLASTANDGTIRIWQIPDGGLKQVIEAHHEAAQAVCFSPDNSLIASAATDRTVCLWSAQDGMLIRRIAPANGATLAFSPDGRILALGGKDNLVYLWQSGSGRLLRSLPGHTAPVTSVTFTPDGTRLITASSDGTIRIRGLADS